MTGELVDARDRARIVTAHDESLFVDAGAGTGKTRTLVERIVALVAAGAGIESVAAITFTENAAAELRTRIREALEDADGPASGRGDTERERCRRALARLDDAAITTLHSFAARLLTDAPLEAGLPPAFEVADAVSAGIERDRWWRARLDEWLDDRELAETWRVGLTLGLRPADLDAIAGPFDANWDLLLRCSFPPAVIPVIGREHLLEPLRALAEFAGKGPAGDRMTEQIEGVLVPALRDAEAEGDPLQVLSLLAETHVKAACGSSHGWQREGADLARVRELCQQLVTRRDGQLHECRTAVAARLAERARAAVLDHAEQRRRRGRLWFHDLLVLAVRLLRDHPATREAMRRRWRAILVDEFQDTDPLQVELVHLIAGEGDGAWDEAAVPGGALFFVGDPAQSIYRFRRAELGLFTEVRERYAAGLVALVVNFRSRPAILAAVNAAFRELFGQDGPVPHKDLHPDPARDRAAGGEGPEVLLLGGPAPGPIGAIREAEAGHVAATLRRARDERWLVSGRDGSRRPAGYADMAVLVPARTSLAQLEEALDSRDIPFRVMSRSLVWESDSVRDLVTILQAIDDPGDAAAVLAALRHPMFACSDDDLVAWTAAGGRWRYDAPFPEGLDGSPVAQAMVALAGYHELRWWLPVDVLAERVIAERRAVELTAVHRRPRDHWRRIRFLADQARAYLDGGGSGLTGFVRWAREQIEAAADAVETITPERDDDAVQILTIHSAKGLEFPLVVLTGLGSTGRTISNVVWQRGRAPEVRLRKGFETAGFDEAAQADRDLGEQESLRLLYVGMTRAADHLVISLYHSPPKNGAANSHAMRLYGLLDRLAAAGALHQQRAPAAGLASAAGAPAVPVSAPAISRAERERFLTERHRLLARVAASVPVTATGLAREAGEPADSLAAEGRVEAADTFVTPPVAAGGATIGSAVHRALELLDLAAPGEREAGRAVTAACGELGVPHLSGEVAGRVRSALRSPSVRLAASRPHWKEAPVVADVGGRIVEGVIDLLVETGDGLVVVDYKTDRVRTDAERGEKTAAYGPQITAYARALASAGLRVHRAVLCFLSEEAPVEVAVLVPRG